MKLLPGLLVTTALLAAPLPDWQGDWQRAAGGVYASRQGEFLRFGNAALERTFRLADGAVRTTKLLNKVSGAEALLVDLAFEAWAGRKYQRKWLTVSQEAGSAEAVIERIDVEMFRFGWWYMGNPELAGYGQPVFVGDVYLGLEYPGAESSATYLRHYPGRSARTGFVSKTAMWGVARDKAHVRQAFFEDYLYTLGGVRSKPFVKYSLIGVTNANTAGRPDERTFLEWLPVDSYATDSEWEDYTSIWKPNPLSFPNGFSRLAAFTAKERTGFGLWLSITGHTLDTRWGRLNGWQVAGATARRAGTTPPN